MDKIAPLDRLHLREGKIRIGMDRVFQKLKQFAFLITGCSWV